VGTQIVKDIITPKLNKIIDLINKEYRVVFLGDYFNPSNPNNLSRKFLSDMFKKITTPKILLIGNHDRDKNGSNCLASISSFLNANDIIVEDTYEENNICYISYTLDFQHIVNIIKTTKCKYIVGHFSFGYMKDEKIMRGELEYDKSYDDKIFILGHIHSHQIKNNINYIGSISPTKLDELNNDFKILQLDNNMNFNWKSIKYDLTQKEIHDISQLGEANENTKVIFDVDSVEEKNKILEQLGDKKLLDIKFKIKNTSIDISMLKIETMVMEYLKIQGKEELYEKTMQYLEGGRN
jgi:hypothetical protein